MGLFKMAIAVSGLALTLVGFGATAVAAASPPTTVTVQDQDQDTGVGAAVRSGSMGHTDADGTQGSFKQAVDGTESGPLDFAKPQVKSVSN